MEAIIVHSCRNRRNAPPKNTSSPIGQYHLLSSTVPSLDLGSIQQTQGFSSLVPSPRYFPTSHDQACAAESGWKVAALRRLENRREREKPAAFATRRQSARQRGCLDATETRTLLRRVLKCVKCVTSAFGPFFSRHTWTPCLASINHRPSTPPRRFNFT